MTVTPDQGLDPAAPRIGATADETQSGGSASEADNIETTPGEKAGSETWQLDIPLGQTTFHVVINAEQRRRLGMIIPPKPAPTEFNAALITEAHRQAVYNVGLCLIARITDALDKHDLDKLNQTPEEHHRDEPHHWPLDGYQPPNGVLPLQYVVEAAADYIATIFGRAAAGRGLEWMSPTSHYTAGDALTSSVLDFLEYYELAEVTPSLTTHRSETDDKNN